MPSARKCFIAAAVIAGLAAPAAFARIIVNTIDPTAVVTDDGRQLIVTGPIGCTSGERAFLHVTVTQRTTGAIAEGDTRVVCSGQSQQWEIHAAAQGDETFEEGAATAVALGRTTARRVTSDAHQWLVEVTLVGE